MQEPEDAEWEEAFGTSPGSLDSLDLPAAGAVEGEDVLRGLTLHPEQGEVLEVSWDAVGGTVRVRWYVGDLLKLDIYREGVWRLTLADQPAGTSGMRLDYLHDALRCTLFVQVWPTLRLFDSPQHTWSDRA